MEKNAELLKDADPAVDPKPSAGAASDLADQVAEKVSVSEP